MFTFGTMATIGGIGIIIFLTALVLQLTFFGGAALGSVTWSITDFILYQYFNSTLRTIMANYYASIGSPK